MIDVMDVAAEKRWTAWRLDGVRLDAIRATRARMFFAVALLSPIVWLLWKL